MQSPSLKTKSQALSEAKESLVKMSDSIDVLLRLVAEQRELLISIQNRFQGQQRDAQATPSQI